MEDIECPICTARQIRSQGTIEGYRQGTSFTVLACAACQVSFVDPMKSDPQLYDHIYKNVASVPGYARYYDLAGEVLAASNPLEHIKFVEDCYFGVVDYLQDQVREKDELILEVGCGQGYLTYALNRAGYNTIGLDISSEVVSLAKSRYGDHYYCGTLATFVHGQGVRPKYVICTELIEHLEDPVGFVREVLRLIGPEGQLILTTPHKASLDMSNWDTELPPVHLWWFTRNALISLAGKVSAEVTFVPLDGFYEKSNVERRLPSGMQLMRPPVLDKSYQVIAPVKKKSPFRVFLRNLEKKLKVWLTGGAPPRHRQLPQGALRNSQEALSHSLCCVFRARR